MGSEETFNWRRLSAIAQSEAGVTISHFCPKTLSESAAATSEAKQKTTSTVLITDNSKLLTGVHLRLRRAPYPPWPHSARECIFRGCGSVPSFRSRFPPPPSRRGRAFRREGCALASLPAGKTAF